MKAKKSYKKGGKFPDLTGDGKVTRADVLKGRGVFEKGGVVEFRSKDRETAKKMLREHFQKKGGRSYLKNAQQPSMSKDTKTGEFIARPQSFAGGGKMKMYKKGGMAGLSGPQKEVYRRGLAAYMSSGNRPKVSQHAWAMARVKSAFGKREAAKIRAGKGKKK